MVEETKRIISAIDLPRGKREHRKVIMENFDAFFAESNLKEISLRVVSAAFTKRSDMQLNRFETLRHKAVLAAEEFFADERQAMRARMEVKASISSDDFRTIGLKWNESERFVEYMYEEMLLPMVDELTRADSYFPGAARTLLVENAAYRTAREGFEKRKQGVNDGKAE